MKYRWFLFLMMYVWMSAYAHAEPTQTLFLIRHAEKASSSRVDPDLSEAGKKRAQQLARILSPQDLQLVITTNYKRTRQTAMPTIEAQDEAEYLLINSVATTVEKVLALPDATSALVVGHSNTVPMIIAALGGPEVEIPESSFDHLYILTIQSGALLNMVELRYGSTGSAQ